MNIRIKDIILCIVYFLAIFVMALCFGNSLLWGLAAAGFCVVLFAVTFILLELTQGDVGWFPYTFCLIVPALLALTPRRASCFLLLHTPVFRVYILINKLQPIVSYVH
jgi:hypothetical protein